MTGIRAYDPKNSLGSIRFRLAILNIILTTTIAFLFSTDNDMVNGTKLLNVAGMSRGKRDGILKNEKGRVVVKVGAMHLKGVW